MQKTYVKSSNGKSAFTIEQIEELLSISRSKNFSELNVKGQALAGGIYEDNEPFDVGDSGRAEENMYTVMQTDMLLFNLLLTFSEIQKIIFLYLMMREAGYNLTHEECARTLSMKRESYMTVMRSVKKKAGKFFNQQSR